MKALRHALERMRAHARDARLLAPTTKQDYWLGYDAALNDALTVMDKRAAPEPNGHRLVLIAGTPLSGFRIYGPFTQFGDAQAWGDRYLPSVEFWVADLTDAPPEPGIKLVSKRED
jgi:hypothetical protein